MKVITLLSALLLSQASLAFTIEKIGSDISHPWGIAVLNDEEVLVTARAGALLRINLTTGQQRAVLPTPFVASFRQGGLLDVAYDEQSNRVHLCYSKPLKGGAGLAIASAKLDGYQLLTPKDIFVSNHRSPSGAHFGCRIVIEGNYLFASLGDRGDRSNAQNPSNHAGSIIRLNLVEPEPANTQKDWLPEIYSMGHRNPQGLALQPNTGLLWSHEHGPRGGDEINLIEQDNNYGWPTVSYGKEYIGGDIGLNSSPDGYTDPLWVWDPSIAPSGMTFYTEEMFPEWQGNLLVGALKFTSIYRIVIDPDSNLPVSEERLFNDEMGRVRDVEQANDGSILVLSDAPNGGLYRISR
jgi:glucose/arabinose dehydrogenase